MVVIECFDHYDCLGEEEEGSYDPVTGAGL
jgi:hypothetical protein